MELNEYVAGKKKKKIVFHYSNGLLSITNTVF